MNRLSEIQEKLLETNAAMAEMEKAIANDRTSLSLSAMMKSLEKRYEKLETDFLSEADSLGVDVCAYRVFGEEERPTVKALSSVLSDFQNLVSTVYDAVKTAVPKLRARISAQIAAETEFRFGYTFPGSVGVVLTIPNQRLLLGESNLDESLRIISEMTKVHDSPEVLQYAKKLGPASVKSLYRWAYDHAESRLGVDIEWRRQELIKRRLFAQGPELERLHRTIGLTSEERVSELTIHASLVGVELTRRSFHLRLDTGEDIRGSLTKDIDISEKQTVELPKRYKAHIRKTEKIRYSTEEEDISYDLLNLERLS
ncbi:MAG: hypothetical protein A2Z77_06340 [Chloroflexi bacterium RBG_13_51_36]|nr:MAG: hypothetical protein A2Z77_06340 [Chloroflexi bacterium RBG_13_51_36]